MHPNIRAAVLLIGCLASLASHASGVAVLTRGTEVFKAGSYAKVARLSTLRLDDLKHATRADNINGLLQLAEQERRIDTVQMMQLGRLFHGLEAGDELLLTCLRHPTCQPGVFSNVLAASKLHASVVRRNPGLGMVQANQEVGALTERLMHRFFESSGWTRVPGEIGRQGIDGLYIKSQNGVIKDVLIAESKYNTSSLQPTRYGTQMSSDWVTRKIANLEAKSPEDPIYNVIRRFISGGSYRAVIWQMKVEDSAIAVSLKKLVGKGGDVTYLDDSVIEWLPVRPLNPIRFDNPANKFERDFLQWYVDELDAIGPLLE